MYIWGNSHTRFCHKITLFKDLGEKVFKGEFAENFFFFTLSLDFELNNLRDTISK